MLTPTEIIEEDIRHAAMELYRTESPSTRKSWGLTWKNETEVLRQEYFKRGRKVVLLKLAEKIRVIEEEKRKISTIKINGHTSSAKEKFIKWREANPDITLSIVSSRYQIASY